MTKSTEVAASSDMMEQLKQSYPSELGALRIQLPRLSMVSQDQKEETRNPKTGKKEIHIVTEAGTFHTELQTDVDEIGEDDKPTGKKLWEKTDIGTKFEAVILFQRKQLRMYDESTETFTNSTVYDTDEEVIPLFANKAEVARGIPAELKAKYMFTDKTGKNRSALEDNRILYVLKDGEVYQLNLRGSSMFSFMAYARKNIPNTVVTEFSSEAMEKGDIAWNKMTFIALRPLEEEEAIDVLERVTQLKNAVSLEKASFAAVRENDSAKNKELNEFAEEATAAAGKKSASKPAALPSGKKKY